MRFHNFMVVLPLTHFGSVTSTLYISKLELLCVVLEYFLNHLDDINFRQMHYVPNIYIHTINNSS